MRGRGLLAVVLVLAGVFSLGLAMGQATGLRLGWLGTTGPAGPLPASRPTTITIPSLSVRAPVHPVGLDGNGAIAAPPIRRAQETGWYRHGPTPGQSGAAVIVGHVDDRDGPAVFHGLPGLSPGDRIEVARQDRLVATFEVTDIRTYPKLALPPDEVYGDRSRPELRLITCGGQWLGGQLGYADNVVVFATLIAPG